MKNLKQDFDDKLQDESFSDDELLSIAREYIGQLQDYICKTFGVKSIEEVE